MKVVLQSMKWEVHTEDGKLLGVITKVERGKYTCLDNRDGSVNGPFQDLDEAACYFEDGDKA